MVFGAVTLVCVGSAVSPFRNISRKQEDWA